MHVFTMQMAAVSPFSGRRYPSVWRASRRYSVSYWLTLQPSVTVFRSSLSGIGNYPASIGSIVAHIDPEQASINPSRPKACIWSRLSSACSSVVVRTTERSARVDFFGKLVAFFRADVRRVP